MAKELSEQDKKELVEAAVEKILENLPKYRLMETMNADAGFRVAFLDGVQWCAARLIIAGERMGWWGILDWVIPRRYGLARAVPDPSEAAREAAYKIHDEHRGSRHAFFRSFVDEILDAAYQAQFGAGDGGAPHPEPTP